jgi:putative ABC transport system permease protein
MRYLAWILGRAHRAWVEAPLLSAVAIGTLAVGVGVTTAVYSVVSGVLLNLLPWPERERTVVLDSVRPLQGSEARNSTAGQLLDWREQADSFQGIVASRYGRASLTDLDESESVVGPQVSVEALSLLGVRPLLGRTFEPADALPDASLVVMLSQGLWERRYGGNPGIVGGLIEIEGLPATVVGVLRREQFFPGPWAELLMPLKLPPGGASRTERDLDVFAVLRAGVAVQQAQAQMSLISERLARQYPETDAGWTVRVRMLADALPGGARLRAALVVGMAAVGLVLGIACANVANLLLARANARQKEVATRCAVGASRGQIIVQLLSESSVLGLLSLPIALFVGWGTLQFFLTLVPPTIPWVQHIFRFDQPVLLFACGASAVTIALFGIVPALHAARVDLQRVFNESGGRGSSGASTWVRSTLAVLQIGLAISLLATAAVLVRSFNALQARDSGVDAGKVLATSVELPSARYSTPAQWLEVQREVLEEVRAPSASAVGITSSLPFGIPGERQPLSIESWPAEKEQPSALWASVSSDYFLALGLAVLDGRPLGPEDRPEGVATAWVNQTLARRYFGSERDALGRRIDFLGRDREIVGVVSDYRNVGMREPPAPQVFVPFAQEPSPSIGLVVSTEGVPGTLASTVRRALREIDADLPLANLLTMEQRIEDDIWGSRFLQRVMVFMSAVALLIAAFGVYAVVNYTTVQYEREFAIRMALGATPLRIALEVLRQLGWLVALGSAVALLLTLALRPVLQGIVYNDSTWSLATFLLITGLLASAALVAAVPPTLRAMSVDPMNVLRKS